MRIGELCLGGDGSAVANRLRAGEREAERQDEVDWSTYSLTSGMRDMEDEDTPIYTAADVKVVFS